MRFIDFKNHFEPFDVFSTQDVLKWDHAFDFRRLVEWQDKNYIKKVINRWYIFNDSKELKSQYLIANQIYAPSYISFESALAHYHLIPEGVYTITSATSLKTNAFATSVGKFSYRHIMKELMFGYQLVRVGGHQFKIAEPEKVLLDYLYLNATLRKAEDFKALRINSDELNSLINQEKLMQYLELFKTVTLEKRLHSFIKTVMHHDERK